MAVENLAVVWMAYKSQNYENVTFSKVHAAYAWNRKRTEAFIRLGMEASFPKRDQNASRWERGCVFAKRSGTTL